MRSPLSLLCIVVILTLWNGGCARRPEVVEKPGPISTAEMLSKLRFRSDSWKDYQAKLQIKGESPKGKFRFRSVLVSRLPDLFRLEAYTIWGQTAGVLIMNKEDSRLWIPSEKVVYVAHNAENLIRYFLGVPIPLQLFGYSLAAAVPPDELDDLDIRRTPSGWSADSNLPRKGLRFVWQFLSQPPALQAISVRGWQSDYSILYTPAVGINFTSTPAKISFLSSDWQMEVEISQMEATRGGQPSLFEMPFPNGVRRVNLDY